MYSVQLFYPDIIYLLKEAEIVKHTFYPFTGNAAGIEDILVFDWTVIRD